MHWVYINSTNTAWAAVCYTDVHTNEPRIHFWSEAKSKNWILWEPSAFGRSVGQTKFDKISPANFAPNSAKNMHQIKPEDICAWLAHCEYASLDRYTLPPQRNRFLIRLDDTLVTSSPVLVRPCQWRSKSIPLTGWYVGEIGVICIFKGNIWFLPW